MSLRLCVILGSLIGFGLFLYSLTMPYYKDAIAFEKLLNNSSNIDDEVYYNKVDKLKTGKILFMDLGAGITIASCTILLFLFATKTKSLSDLNTLKTYNRITIFISANLVWLSALPGTHWYYFFRAMRGDYPPFADSIGIPIMTETSFILYMLIPLNVFLFLMMINSSLPTKLLASTNKYTKFKICNEIIFGICLLLNLICLLGSIIDGDHFAIPINLFFAYLLLTLRAGQISR